MRHGVPHLTSISIPVNEAYCKLIPGYLGSFFQRRKKVSQQLFEQAGDFHMACPDHHNGELSPIYDVACHVPNNIFVQFVSGSGMIVSR